MSNIAWGRFAIFSAAVMAAGWGIMRITTPTEEQLYNKLSPELKRKVDEVRAQREGRTAMQDRLKAADESDTVVWGDAGASNRTGRRV